MPQGQDYSKLFSEIFRAVFPVKLLAYYRVKEAPNKARIDRLARLYALEATTLFINADFTAILARLRRNPQTPVASLIKDALQFPPHNSDTAERLLQDGIEAYRQLATSEKSRDNLLSDLRSTHVVFVNSTVEATQAVLSRIIDDTAGAAVEHLLSEEGLIEIITQRRSPSWEDKTFEEFGQEMSKAIDPANQTGVRSNKYWYAVKKEISILVCTDDKKYKSLRTQLNTLGTKSQTAVVSMIAAAMAAYIGAIAGLLVPMCALVLLAMMRVGKNAFCAQKELNMRIENEGRSKKGGRAKVR
jgi:hypothetical protein